MLPFRFQLGIGYSSDSLIALPVQSADNPRSGAYNTGSCGHRVTDQESTNPLCPHPAQTTLSFLVGPSYSTLLGAREDKKTSVVSAGEFSTTMRNWQGPRILTVDDANRL